jgi:hypothetical protein
MKVATTPPTAGPEQQQQQQQSGDKEESEEDWVVPSSRWMDTLWGQLSLGQCSKHMSNLHNPQHDDWVDTDIHVPVDHDAHTVLSELTFQKPSRRHHNSSSNNTTHQDKAQPEGGCGTALLDAWSQDLDCMPPPGERRQSPPSSPSRNDNKARRPPLGPSPSLLQRWEHEGILFTRSDHGGGSVDSVYSKSLF